MLCISAVTQIEQVCLATLDDDDWARCYALYCATHEESGSRARSLQAYRTWQLGQAAGEQPPVRVDRTRGLQPHRPGQYHAAQGRP
ncbi:MAG TPA: hypothetical protein VMF89_27760 [Polyangiales bacterium]|nr:hypothetical protein [Polyangiales bacterium]